MCCSWPPQRQLRSRNAASLIPHHRQRCLEDGLPLTFRLQARRFCGGHWCCEAWLPSQVWNFATLDGTSPPTTTAVRCSIASQVIVRTSRSELACQYYLFDNESKLTAWCHFSWPSELWQTSCTCLPRQGRVRAAVAVQPRPRRSRGQRMRKVHSCASKDSDRAGRTRLLGTGPVEIGVWLELGAGTKTCTQRRQRT